MKRALIIIGILLVGVAGIIIPAKLRKAPVRTKPPAVAPLVSVANPFVKEGNLMIGGNGTVRSTKEVPVASEVSGKIISVSSRLVPGGKFSRGQTLVTIDQSDYTNAVEVQRAAVTQRKYELILAREESEIAKQEWDRAQRRAGTNEAAPSGELGSLALKEPQIRLAEAALRSAEAQLADAEKRLSRSQIRAPFNGQVKTKEVDIGQYLAPGQAVATFYGTDQVEVTVALASSAAELLQDVGGNSRPPATVSAEIAGQKYTWEGYVHRVEGLDPSTRTLNVAVRVDNPYSSKHERPLLVDTFANVEIAGKEVDSALQIPTSALRANSTIWIVKDGKVLIKPVSVLQESNETTYIAAEGMADTDDIIVSDLDVVTEGMSVRISK